MFGVLKIKNVSDWFVDVWVIHKFLQRNLIQGSMNSEELDFDWSAFS